MEHYRSVSFWELPPPGSLPPIIPLSFTTLVLQISLGNIRCTSLQRTVRSNRSGMCIRCVSGLVLVICRQGLKITTQWNPGEWGWEECFSCLFCWLACVRPTELLRQGIPPHHRKQVGSLGPSWGCSRWDWLTCCRGWRRLASDWSSREVRWQQSWTGPQRVWRAFISTVYRQDGLTGRWERVILWRKSTVQSKTDRKPNLWPVFWPTAFSSAVHRAKTNIHFHCQVCQWISRLIDYFIWSKIPITIF